MSILKHEQGKNHQEIKVQFFQDQRAKRTGVHTDEKDLQRQLKEIEKAAAAAVEQVLASGKQPHLYPHPHHSYLARENAHTNHGTWLRR